MNDIDNLLEKYFNGTSSAEEEKRIKDYFEGSDILLGHEIYRPLFAVFNSEKQVKAPEILLPVEKKKESSSLTRRIIIFATGVAAIALLAVKLSISHSAPIQYPKYVVIMNGEKVINQSKARQYAENMFRETEKILEGSYQPLREVADIKKDLNAEKILRETDQKIEDIKTNYKQ